MNILIVSPKFHPVIGGGETFVLNSIEGLHRAGMKVAIAVEPHPKRDTASYPYPVYQIEGLSDSKLDVLKAPDGLYKLIAAIKPDIIHVHGYFGLLALGLCVNSAAPVVASIHSTPVWGQRIVGGMSGFEQEKVFAQKILSFTKPRVVTAANGVYAEAARRLVGGKMPVELYPYPILTAFYEKHDRSKYRQEFGLKDTDILLTVPSRIIERKGIKEAVMAMQELPENFYLCLPCAVNPLDQDYWEATRTSKDYRRVRGRVIVPSQEILHEQMPLLYAATDIVVMPSYYEGAPVATVEAMASKRPFIGADSQGINSFIRHKENGLLVPKQSTKELAEAIREFAYDKQLQDKLTLQAARDVAHLSWKVQLPKLIELYQKLLR